MIALLPIKEHSERVPGKNFRELGGKPLYRWILDTLLSVEEIENVVINTDSEEIFRTAFDARVVVRDRKSWLRGDDVSMNRIIADDLANTDGGCYIQTHATNPFLRADTIKTALGLFAASSYHDSLFSVDRIQQRLYAPDMRPINHDPGNLIPTQELEPICSENSCLYIFTKASFAATGARIGKRPMRFETPRAESIDIDTEEDWELARRIME